MKHKYLKINPYVFFPSAILVAIFLAASMYFTSSKNGDDPLTLFLGKLQTFITVKLGWFYLLSAAFFLVFVLWIMFSKHGKIKLGRDGDEPEYSLFSWFAMLFSAGIGIGLLFYGVAEPIGIFSTPPSSAIVPESAEAATAAMRYTFFHWGLHAWGIYIVIGLSMAYFSYRHKLPLTLRSVLYPILGEKIYGFWGNAVEVFAVIGTLFGVATSLGYGVMQVNSGMAHLNVLNNSTGNQIILIIIITLIATLSVVSGVNKGVRRLSEINLLLALLLLLFVFFVGPTTFLFKAFSLNLGNYLQTIVGTTFQTDIFNNNQFHTTVFYLAWWIGWSPFVGMFIARISKGRTIREFIGCVLLVPVILTFTWMTVFGNTAIHMELFGNGGMVAAVKTDVSTALFVMLENLPFQKISCTLAIFVIIFFFVTSSDSASLVIDIITSGDQKNPPVWQKIFWAFAQGVVAIALLVTGGLLALQTAVITTALPFAVVMLFICYALWKALRTDTALKEAKESVWEQNILLAKTSISVPGIQPVVTPISETYELEVEGILPSSGVIDQISEMSSDGDYSKDWKKRLTRLKSKHYPEYFADQYEHTDDDNLKKANQRLKAFINDVVKPAFIDIEKELVKYSRTVKISISEHQASVIVMKSDIEELYYGIRGKAYHKLGYTFPAFDPTDSEVKCYAQVMLRSGGKKIHELKKFTKDNIIHDFLNEYEKWAILN
ncbi:MAG: BCCT family transporter [Lentisphaerae bacterium]|nr:BCCT family transporter [Lentisphaerota bacterium]MCP4102977.1 BCCT family transporter [Lentisphaerota bacterium]